MQATHSKRLAWWSLLVVGSCCAGPLAAAAEPAAAPPPVVFEGFGLGDFSGAGSLATAIGSAAPRDASSNLPLDIVVRGPTGRDAASDQLATEIRSRIEQLDLSAGLVTNRATARDGFAAWSGRVAVAAEHATGRDVLELRTSLTQAHQTGVLGIEVGPRIERRLRRGAVLFLDGKAEARTERSVETGSWLTPSETPNGMLGVAARTGLTR